MQKSHAVLRTKTGCLTCRQRRKKCDERHPSCMNCKISNRPCAWPAPGDLFDGRHGQRRRSTAQDVPQPIHQQKDLSLTTEASISSQVIRESLETSVGHHFTNTYYALLINPESHPDFYNDWINDINAYMLDNGGVRYSVLANAASNLFLAGEAPQMQEVALSYYSRSLRGLNKTVARASPGQFGYRNSVLTNIMMLYLHGCMGYGTYTDIPLHVSAAIRIVISEYLQSDVPVPISRPYDRLALESVIYQVFLVRMGLWSEAPGEGLDFNFDPHFWLQCEALLTRTNLFPDQSNTRNSPVLGIPFALYKIMLMIKVLWGIDRASKEFHRCLRQLQRELQPWEGHFRNTSDEDQGSVILSNSFESASESETFSKDATTLMALGASLLSVHLSTLGSGAIPSPTTEESWQVSRIITVLKRRHGDQKWAACHLGNYPLYVVGHFMRTPEQIDLVRQELKLRSKEMAWSQVHRFWNSLEEVWRGRGQCLQSVNP